MDNNDTILIEGLTKGFCGCLTTVSTFISELFMLYHKSKLEIKNQTPTNSQIIRNKSTENVSRIDNSNDINHPNRCFAQLSLLKLSFAYGFGTLFVAQVLGFIVKGIATTY